MEIPMIEAPKVCANCKWWTNDGHAGMGTCHFTPLDCRKGIEDFCSHFELFPISIREPNFELNYPPFQVVN